MKKSLIIIFLVTCMIFLGTISYAGNMIDYSVDPDICRFSDYSSTDDTLPFIRISAGRTEIDTDVNKSGICISNNDISISSAMSKVQIMASSSEIKLTSSIEHSILLSPNQVISGEIKGTTMLMGSIVNITKEAKITGDLIVLAGTVIFDGAASGNVIIVANNINVGENSNITGSLRMTGNDIIVSDSANITGFSYAKYSDNLSVPAALKELILIVKEEVTSDVGSKARLPILSIVISSLILGVIYTLIKTKTKVFDSACGKLQGSAIKVIISGFVALFVFPIILIITLIISVLGLHVVGIPVLVCYIAILIVAGVMKEFIVTTIISEYMLKTNYGKYFDSNLSKFILFVVVLILMSLLVYIPVVGTYIDYLFFVISLGTFITFTVLFKTLKK